MLENKNLSEILENHFGRKHCVLVGSGTTGLILSLKALNLPKDSEVIIPNLTCLVVAMAVRISNLKPVFVDINEKDYNIDSKKIEEKISVKTKAIMAVHSFGHSFDEPTIRKICNNNNLVFIEDFCQSFGGELNRSLHGSFGDIAITSFSIGKTMPTSGGGAILTDSSEIYKKLLLDLKNLKPINWSSRSNKILLDNVRNPPNKLAYSAINFLSKPYNKKINLLGLIPYIFLFFFYINKNIFLHSLTVKQYLQIISNIGKMSLIQKLTVKQSLLYQKNLNCDFFKVPLLKSRKGIIWKYSVIVQKSSRKSIFKEIKKMGYNVFQDLNIGNSYYPPFNECWPSNELFPVSKRISSNIINLPVGLDIDDENIEEICNILNKAVENIETKS